MEFCLVNIVLGDTALPKPIPLPVPPAPPKPEKVYDYTPPKVIPKIIPYFLSLLWYSNNSMLVYLALGWVLFKYM